MLNLAHGDAEYDSVTENQMETLFPLLKRELRGSESVVLDFGCGPGRFTEALADCVNGSAIGVDVAPELLKLAPKSPRVVYQLIDAGALPFDDACFDLVWSCLVLGGIPDLQLSMGR